MKKIFIILLILFFTIGAKAEISKPAKHLSIYKTEQKKNRNHLTNDLLKSYLEMSAFKHKTLTQNIANVNTPGYKANEVASPNQYEDLSTGGSNSRKIAMNITSEKHIKNNRNVSKQFASHKLKDPYEIKPNGNNVSLAQQMMKLSQNQQDYNAALKSYAVTNSLVSSVIGK